MLPIPALLEKRLEFGNMQQIRIAKLYDAIHEKEVKASHLRNVCQVKFYQNGKLAFEITVSNKKTAVHIVTQIHPGIDDKWTFDKVEYNSFRQEADK